MTVTVLLSSGETDTWDDAQWERTLDNALLIKDGSTITAVYAPGMWMRVTVEEPSD